MYRSRSLFSYCFIIVCTLIIGGLVSVGVYEVMDFLDFSRRVCERTSHISAVLIGLVFAISYADNTPNT